MSRKLCQISENIGALLVKQAAHELKNYILYSSFSNYFCIEGILSLQEYFYKRALEEKLHHEWILNYLNDADFRLMYPAIEENKEQTITSVLDPFVRTVDREIQTTQMLYNIYNAAEAEKDYMTCSWLYKDLIREQVEEESISRTAVGIMETDANIFVKGKKILELLN